MIGLVAVRELDGDLMPGDVVQQITVHSSLLDDEPALAYVRARVALAVTDHPDAAVTDTNPVRTYVFSPAYLDGVLRRNIHVMHVGGQLPVNMAAVIAVWRRP